MNFKLRHIVVLVLLLALQPKAFAQEPLIRQFPRLDTIPPDTGPNRKNYFASIIGYGLLFGPTDSAGSNITLGNSYYLSLGWRYKKKHSAFFNTGIDFSLEHRNFRIAQTDEKVFGGRFKHQKERFSQYTLNLSFFMRFNLVKRGDHLGKYIDLYATGIYAPIVRHYTYDSIDGAYGSQKGKHVFSKLTYIERFFGQVGIRYGISFFQLNAFYRPLNMFKKPDRFPWPELPRFGAGIVLDIADKNTR